MYVVLNYVLVAKLVAVYGHGVALRNRYLYGGVQPGEIEAFGLQLPRVQALVFRIGGGVLAQRYAAENACVTDEIVGYGGVGAAAALIAHAAADHALDDFGALLVCLCLVRHRRDRGCHVVVPEALI